MEIVPAATLKVALTDPAGTVTELGTVNWLLLEDNVTVAPPLGAAAESVTAQPVELPEFSGNVEHCKPETVGNGAFSWIVVVCELPL